MQQFFPTLGLDRVSSNVPKKKWIYYSTCSFSAVSGITRWTSLIDVESISPLLSTVSIDSPLLLLSETVEFPNIKAELILHIICKSVIKPSHISEKKSKHQWFKFLFWRGRYKFVCYRQLSNFFFSDVSFYLVSFQFYLIIFFFNFHDNLP